MEIPGVEKGVYIQDSLNNGTKFFDVGEVYDQLKAEGGFEDADLWPINEETIRLAMESNMPIDFIHSDIQTLIAQNEGKSWADLPARVKEWKWIEQNAKNDRYIRVGDSWIPQVAP